MKIGLITLWGFGYGQNIFRSGRLIWALSTKGLEKN
jgi:hypothetical protein